MKENASDKAITSYDVEGITELSKKRLHEIVLQLFVHSLVLVISVVLLFFYGMYGGIALACISLFFGGRLLTKIILADYSHIKGEIIDVRKEVKVIRTTKVGGINPFGVRKYDHDGKNEIRLEIFIKKDEKIRGYFLNDVNEEHAEYYDKKGEAVHIWGTHFPIRLGAEDDRWLCPFCGEFNEKNEKSCANCNRRILK